MDRAEAEERAALIIGQVLAAIERTEGVTREQAAILLKRYEKDAVAVVPALTADDDIDIWAVYIAGAVIAALNVEARRTYGEPLEYWGAA